MSRAVGALARWIFKHVSISSRLEKSAFVQALAAKLQARKWINSALTRHPIRRCLPGSGVRYQLETFEALAVERMYFGDPVYTEIFSPTPPGSFIDLGCNSGIFPCFLSHLANGRPLSGLCVDANSAQIELARKSATLNGWKDVHFHFGLAGNRETADEKAEFFLHATSLGSSQFAYSESESGRSNQWSRTTVPAVKIADLWNNLFGQDTRCECLKIDIEGSEMLFLKSESSFLQRVDAILLEWHAWTTSREEVVQYLSENHFTLARELERLPRHGVLFFHRS